MRRAVDDLKRATKEIESRLDMLEWKSETLSQNSSDSYMHMPDQEIPNVSLLLKDTTRVKEEYTQVKEDLKTIIETQRASMEQLHESLDSTGERFTRLRELIGDFPQ